MMNRHPPASEVSSATEPPRCSSSSATMARPSPVPEPTSGWARTPGSKTFSRSASGIPRPLSWTTRR